MICKDCPYWLEDDVVTMEPSHEEALKYGSGYCVIQDLYTGKDPEDKCDIDNESLLV